MAAIAQSLPRSSGRLGWFRDFLRDELAPYPGRAALVVRMVTAATLVMIIGMTFQMPYSVYAALYGLILPRESLEATASAVRGLVVGVVLAGAYVLVGAMLFLGSPMLRLLWVVVTLFLVFYLLSAMHSYVASARFGYLIVIAIPLWVRQISPNQKVEQTLWAVGALSLAGIITLALEMFFAAFRRTDDLIGGITARLECVEELLDGYAEARNVEATTQTAITRFAMVGASGLRRMLQRSDYEPQYKQEMAAVVALVARLVDIAANLRVSSSASEDDRKQIRGIVDNIVEIRGDLTRGTVPRQIEYHEKADAPLLNEIERTVSMIPEVFTGSRSLSIYEPQPLDRERPATLLAPGALSNPEHLKFGLRGCLAASICYIIYNTLFWPGISTALITCFVTALTTIGTSHQKQILRFAGAIVGGFLIGMGSQVFILPYLDSIAGFVVLFVLVTALSSWFVTSSPRLSYFGVQVALAFYLINLQEFKIQTSLAVARDRVVGMLLGLFMMWLVFDHLWSAPAALEMRKAFLSGLRFIAQLAREPVSNDLRTAIERSDALREMINTSFNNVRSLADGVLFEFGPSRQQDLAFRDRIRRWQPQLRVLFVMRIASLKYRLQLTGFELPERVLSVLQEYDDHSARILEEMADRIEHNAAQARNSVDHSHELLNKTVQGIQAEEWPQLPTGRAQSLITLLRGIDGLTTSLASEIVAEFGTLPDHSQLRPV
jgi:multidrug resistance protein MdtO